MEFGNLLQSKKTQAEELKRPIFSILRVYVCFTELKAGDDQIRQSDFLEIYPRESCPCNTINIRLLHQFIFSNIQTFILLSYRQAQKTSAAVILLSTCIISSRIQIWNEDTDIKLGVNNSD